MARLCADVPEAAAAQELETAFIRLIRQRRADGLPGWLAQAEQAEPPEFKVSTAERKWTGGAE